MINIIFEGEVYAVLDITNTAYVCSPKYPNEGYHYIPKEKAEVI